VIIKIVLLAALIVMPIWLLRVGTTSRQAWSKLGVMLLFLLAITDVLAPSATNDVAHVVGVGRGADLLLYCLTIAFLVASTGHYLRHHDDATKLVKFLRKVAITEAVTTEHNRKIIEKLRQQ
jgi:small membrane protein